MAYAGTTAAQASLHVSRSNHASALIPTNVVFSCGGYARRNPLNLATAAALPSNTYSNTFPGTLTATANAALTVDGVAVTKGMYILVKNEANAANNGIYVVTNPGAVGAAYVLSRVIDASANSQLSSVVYNTVAALPSNTYNAASQTLTSTLAPPTSSAPSTATTGGTLAAGTYYAKITAINALGETIASTEQSQITTGATSTITWNWAAVAGATGYKVYVGTATNAENTVTTVGNVTSTIQTATYATAGTPPTANTAVTPGVLVVAGVTTTAGMLLFVKNEVVPSNNGLYVVTQAGSANQPFILTRVADSTANIVQPGAVFSILAGTANANTYWSETTVAPVVSGTTNRTFASQTTAPNADAYQLVGTADLFDAVNNNVIPSNDLLHFPRHSHTATLMTTTVLVVGGMNAQGEALAQCETYTMSTDNFTVVGYLNQARHSHQAIKFSAGTQSGNVIVVGGSNGGALASCEIFNGTTWAITGSMRHSRVGHQVVQLASGNLLVFGGRNANEEDVLDVELYTQSTGLWSVVGQMRIGRTGHQAVLMTGGNVFICGGYNAAQSSNPLPTTQGGFLQSTEIYNTTTNTSAYSGNMQAARHRHTATLRNDNAILIAGGQNLSGQPAALLSAYEVFDSGGVASTAGVNMITPRMGHTAVLTTTGSSTGEIVFVGGNAVNTGSFPNVEAYN